MKLVAMSKGNRSLLGFCDKGLSMKKLVELFLSLSTCESIKSFLLRRAYLHNKNIAQNIII